MIRFLDANDTYITRGSGHPSDMLGALSDQYGRRPVLLLSRDIATALGFFVARAVPALRAVEFKARFPGKIVTVLQLVTLLALVVGAQPLTPFITLVALASALAIADYAHALLSARAR